MRHDIPVMKIVNWLTLSYSAVVRSPSMLIRT